MLESSVPGDPETPRFPTPDRVAELLSEKPGRWLPDLPGRTHPRHAGVAAALYWDPDPICLLTLRTAALRHGGEISFPGGRIEAGEDAQAAAARELREELGIHPLRILGPLSSRPVFTSKWRLIPWAYQIDGRHIQPQDGEVELVHSLRLREILQRSHIDAIEFPAWGEPELSPLIPTDGELVFGATAHCLWELLGLLAPEFDLALPARRPGRYAWEDLRRDDYERSS